MPQLSIFTASTPWLTFPDLVPAAKQAGFQGLEVGMKERRYDPEQPPNPWTNNPACIDWDHHLEEATTLKALLDEHEMACSAIGSYVSVDDIDRIAKAVEAAKILGCEFIRVTAPKYDPGIGYRALLAEARACYRDLDQISAETGIDSLIEIHHRTICSSASGAMRVLEGLDPTHVGAILDPGNTIDEGFEDLRMAVDLLGPFLRHVHCKDLTRVPADDGRPGGAKWKGQMTSPGEGDVDWPGAIAILTEAGYDGWYVTENFADRDQGPDAIAADHQWIDGLTANMRQTTTS